LDAHGKKALGVLHLEIELSGGGQTAQQNRRRPVMDLTQTAQTNKALIERAYSAFAQGDIPTVLQALDDQILWHVPGRGPLSRDYH
jgi:hypothetical protein